MLSLGRVGAISFISLRTTEKAGCLPRGLSRSLERSLRLGPHILTQPRVIPTSWREPAGKVTHNSRFLRVRPAGSTWLRPRPCARRRHLFPSEIFAGIPFRISPLSPEENSRLCMDATSMLRASVKARQSCSRRLCPFLLPRHRSRWGLSYKTELPGCRWQCWGPMAAYTSSREGGSILARGELLSCILGGVPCEITSRIRSRSQLTQRRGGKSRSLFLGKYLRLPPIRRPPVSAPA